MYFGCRDRSAPTEYPFLAAETIPATVSGSSGHQTDRSIMSIRGPVNEFILGIIKGRILETYERFYDDRVVVNGDGVRERNGKDANTVFLASFLESIHIRHGFFAQSVLVDGPKAVIEWSWDFKPKVGSRTIWQRLVLQSWAKNKIIGETWFHRRTIRVPADWLNENPYMPAPSDKNILAPFPPEKFL